MRLHNRERVEGRMAAKVNAVLDVYRKKINSRLGSPPDAARISPDLWNQLERDLAAELEVQLTDAYGKAAQQHGLGKPEAKVLAQEWARDRARETANRAVNTSRESLTKATVDWRQRAATGERIEKTEIQDQTKKIFGPSKAERIAVNETTTAVTQGSESAIEQTVGLSEDDEWFNQTNRLKACPICQPLHRVKRKVWGLLYPDGPPIHVGCECHIHYANTPEGRRAIAQKQPKEETKIVA